MDNKGQTLVLFVLIMPFLLTLFMVVNDIGNLMIDQNKYELEIKNAISYGLKHINEDNINDKINSLLNYEIKENKQIIKEDNKIEIKVLKKNKVVGFNFNTEMDYVGYIENDKIIIDRR